MRTRRQERRKEREERERGGREGREQRGVKRREDIYEHLIIQSIIWSLLLT